MDLKSLFYIDDDAAKGTTTFMLDENCPPLPLPKLNDSLDRYYRNLLPFGTAEELKSSKKVIDEFRNGVGKELHALLEKKAGSVKNWVDDWWEKYAYMATRTPLLPNCSMAQPLCLQPVGIQETEKNGTKILARIMHYNMNLWNLIRVEKLKPARTADGSSLSSALWRRFYNTTRVPGEEMDEVVCYFKTAREGKCPSHVVVIGNGRIFSFDTLNEQGDIISPQQMHQVFSDIKEEIAQGEQGPLVPLLTCDDRTSWAKNRKHLLGLSENNRKIIKVIEESQTILSLDSHEPADYSEAALHTVAGDLHSRWADKSSIFVQFKNGMNGCIGEHSAYDGTLSMSFDVFIQLSCMENPEPDWSLTAPPVRYHEHKFDVDDHIRKEIGRLQESVEEKQYSVVVVWNEFQHFGKAFMKKYKIHPDAFVQLALQLTYFKMHKKLAPTYETAMTRAFYKGRTETVRSCSIEMAEWVMAMMNSNDLKNEWVLFKRAIDTQNRLMKEAREGNGFDRHLFALWCLGYEKGYDTHPMYTDPLFSKSGGGGNFVLSSSLLGYSINTGMVAPMVRDGYGLFYSITNNEIYTMVSSYRESPETSSSKYTKELEETMLDMRSLIELAHSSHHPKL